MQSLIDTPFLSKQWSVYPNIIGKLPEDRWIYMSSKDYMLPYVRGCLFTAQLENGALIRQLAQEFNEDDLGCQFALVLSCERSSTLIVEWESYAVCKRMICSDSFIARLNQIKCDFYLTHVGGSTGLYRECIRKQIAPAENIDDPHEQCSGFYLTSEVKIKLSM